MEILGVLAGRGGCTLCFFYSVLLCVEHCVSVLPVFSLLQIKNV